MTIVRLTLLEASILFGLLVFGYEIAVSFGRKWAVSVIPNPRHNLYHLGIVDTTSVTTRKERMMRLLQSSHTTTILRNTSFGLIADALLHPTLLAHPKPHHIVILTNSTDENRLEFYVTSALEHKSVTMISIWNLKQQQTPCETIISSRQNVQLIEHRISSLPHMSNCNSKSNRNLQEVAEEKDGNVEDSPIDILFVDGTVELSIEELTNYIHQSSLDETTNFTLLVELKNRSIIPHWVQALTDWDSMTDFSIRLPLPPPRAKQLRNYIVAFPDSRSESFWHLNEAEWNRRLVDKLRDSSKSFALDSTIMSQFAFPSKQSEVEFCRTNSAHVACESGGSGFDPSKHNTPADALFVERSLQGKHAGRGVFSSMDIPPDSYIGIDVAELRLPWTSTQLIYKFTEVDHDIHEFAHEQLFAYFDGYGFIRDVWGMPQYVVDATKVTFVNHGCHGSNNVGPTSPHHESNLEVPAALDDKDKLWETIPPDYLEAELDDQLYLPVRNSDLLMSSESNQFIAAGEEILDNYLTFAGTDGVEFWKYVKSLRRECQGLAGFIEEWETMYKQEKKQSEENFTAATRSSTYNDEEPFRNLNCSNPQDPTTIA